MAGELEVSDHCSSNKAALLLVGASVMSLPLRLLLRLLILLLPLLRRFGTSDDSLSVNQLITDSAVFFTSCLPAVITKKTIQIMNATLINISNTPSASRAALRPLLLSMLLLVSIKYKHPTAVTNTASMPANCDTQIVLGPWWLGHARCMLVVVCLCCSHAWQPSEKQRHAAVTTTTDVPWTQLV